MLCNCVNGEVLKHHFLIFSFLKIIFLSCHRKKNGKMSAISARIPCIRSNWPSSMIKPLLDLNSWVLRYNLCSYRMKPLFTARTKANNEESTLDLCIDQTDRTPCFKGQLFHVFVPSFLKMKPRFMSMIANFTVTQVARTKSNNEERRLWETFSCLLIFYLITTEETKMIVKIVERNLSVRNGNSPGSKISIIK